MLDTDRDTEVATLANGVRVVTIERPDLASVSVSVFVRTGSRDETPRQSGISHVVEHMAFKGTHTRSCQQINFDAERLGAEVNAHTDKDHTAYHMHGMARDAERFIEMLGDIVQGSTFPEAELERERQVILHELAEEEDDPLDTAFKLFDKCCYGRHPLAQPVIGTRRNIERFSRADLLEYVASQYSGANVIVGIAGRLERASVLGAAEQAFGAMRRGEENHVDAPAYIGGIAARRQPGYSQTHIVLGYPIPTLKEDHHAGLVAAALFGEGMSSPLMDEIRERRGLVYYAACSADVSDIAGQFVIEASTSPEQLDELCVEIKRLLEAHAEAVDEIGLERARNQIAVRRLQARERPYRRLEEAAQDLYVYGRVRTRAELMASIEAVSAEQVRAAFERMLASPASAAVAGKVPAGTRERLRSVLSRR